MKATIALIALSICSLSAATGQAPAKGDALYVSAAGLESLVPNELLYMVPVANLDCPETTAHCFYHFRPCEKVYVRAIKKDGRLLIDALSFPQAGFAFSGDWSQVLAPSLSMCLSALTHADIKIGDKKSRSFGQTFEADPVDCDRAHLPTPCESDRPRPLLEERDDLSASAFNGWVVLGTVDQHQ